MKQSFKHKNKIKITDILLGIVFALFFISISVVAVVNFRPLYYLDINLLNIADTSGYSINIIKENYNTLIDYCSPFFQGPLNFPTLTSSANGLQHFDEVKNIFVVFYYLAAFTFILILVIIIYKKKKQDTTYLVVSSITTIVLPIIVALASLINFDATFIIFHKIFFRNDYWYFDSELDPIITLLPQAYFLHCVVFIIACILIGSLSLFLASVLAKRKILRIKD